MKRIFTIFTIAMLALAACEPVDEGGNTNGNGNENTEGENNGNDNTGGENNDNENPGNDNPGGENGGNEDDGTPKIKITSKVNTTIGPGSVVGRISYELINPVEGLTVEAKSNVEWLGEFDYKDMGKIGYRAEKNPSENPREGVITVTYGESSVDVNVTQEGNPLPTDKFIEAPMLTGHYYGNIQGLYNFYLAFTDKGMSAYEPIAHPFYYFDVPNAWYYTVDLYLDRPAEYTEGEPIIVPNGKYGFDASSQGWPNMFGHEFSWLQQNDEYGNCPPQTLFNTGELVVEDGKVTLKVTMTVEGIEETHTVTYEGDYELVDMTGIEYM